MLEILARPLDAELFAPFGQVLDCAGEADRIINAGLCGRWHDRAALDFGAETGGRAGISIFRSEARRLPYVCDLLERHPDGSQAFVPMSENPFLVIVAPDDNGRPGTPQAFLTAPGQAINLNRGTWHGVLTPLEYIGTFAVIDRIGPTPNLEEHVLAEPFRVIGPGSTA